MEQTMSTKEIDDQHDEDWEPVEAKKPPTASAVYSIRFAGNELAGLRSIARREHIRISDIVHRAIDLYLTADETFTIRVGSPNRLMSTHFYSVATPGSITTAIERNSTFIPTAP